MASSRALRARGGFIVGARDGLGPVVVRDVGEARPRSTYGRGCGCVAGGVRVSVSVVVFNFIYITSKLRGLGPGLLSGPAILLGASSKPAGFFCHLAQPNTRGLRATRERLREELKEVGNSWKPGTQLCV